MCREGLERGAQLAGALADWVCELPLGMRLVAAAHSVASLATAASLAAGLCQSADAQQAMAALRQVSLRDAVVVRGLL